VEKAYRVPARSAATSVAEGRAMKRIADRLHVTARTVALSQILDCGAPRVKTSAEVVQYALDS
jgi:hypothetical protein